MICTGRAGAEKKLPTRSVATGGAGAATFLLGGGAGAGPRLAGLLAL